MTPDEILRSAATRLRTQYRHSDAVAQWLESWIGYSDAVSRPTEYGRALGYARTVLAHICRDHPKWRMP